MTFLGNFWDCRAIVDECLAFIPTSCWNHYLPPISYPLLLLLVSAFSFSSVAFSLWRTLSYSSFGGLIVVIPLGTREFRFFHIVRLIDHSCLGASPYRLFLIFWEEVWCWVCFVSVDYF